MPLIILCGYPSSGKSTLATKLANYLKEEWKKEVVIVREEDNFRGEKNQILDDSRKEKELRAKTKSEAQRLLSKTSIVILDALNYIKGYRYELFCMSKAVPTRQVTIQCDISELQAWEWNLKKPDSEQYKKEVFDHIIQRFELPDPQNRWDSPYFSVIAGEELDMKSIYLSLFSNRPPKQNQSTVNKPVSETNFLQTLEKVTSDIIQVIISDQKDNSAEPHEIEVPHSKSKIKLEEPAKLSQLNKLKRQFINLTKNTSFSTGDPGELFVQYLNSQFKEKE